MGWCIPAPAPVSMGVTVYNQDVRQWLLDHKDEGERYHAVIADPPYHLGNGFMSQKWDKGEIAFDVEMWSAVIAALKPGGFGAIYTAGVSYHKVASAISEAGGDIYPMLAWIHSKGMGLGRKFKAHEGYAYGKQALKPAVEPVVLFQKPYSKTGEDTLAEYGTGSLNLLDAATQYDVAWNGNKKYKFRKTATGNWVIRMPSNVIISREAAKEIEGSEFFKQTDEWAVAVEVNIAAHNRVKYSGKASRVERDAGLSELESVDVGVLNGRRSGLFVGPKPTGKNDHPTIKPLDFARWLGGLLLPPREYGPFRLFNPFSGTGSDAIGARLAGWDDIECVEQDAKYVNMSRLRFKYHTEDKICIVD